MYIHAYIRMCPCMQNKKLDVVYSKLAKPNAFDTYVSMYTQSLISPCSSPHVQKKERVLRSLENSTSMLFIVYMAQQLQQQLEQLQQQLQQHDAADAAEAAGVALLQRLHLCFLFLYFVFAPDLSVHCVCLVGLFFWLPLLPFYVSVSVARLYG